jgi:hypothetical protein
VGDDHYARTGGVRLGESCDCLRDSRQISLVWLPARRGPCFGLRFIAYNNIGIWKNLLELCMEELRNERCREIENESLGVI